MLQFLELEDRQDGAGCCYHGPQGVESRLLRLKPDGWCKEESGTGARMHGKATLVLTVHKAINKSVSQKSVISKISGSGQESKNPKPRNICVEISLTLKHQAAAEALIRVGCFEWRGMEGDLHIRIHRPLLGQSSCLTADWSSRRTSWTP